MNYKCVAVFCFVCFGLCLPLAVGSGWFLQRIIYYQLETTTCTVISAKFTNCSAPAIYRCVDLILEGWVCGMNLTVDQLTVYTIDEVPKYLPPVPSVAPCWYSPHYCELYAEPGRSTYKLSATVVFCVAAVLTLAFLACGVFFYRKHGPSAELDPLLSTSKETL